jgi:hypothetical protein
LDKAGRKRTDDRTRKRQVLRAKLIAYKGGVCERCLKPYHPNVMEFHHRNPDSKRLPLNAANLTEVSWKLVKAEADKCHLLCSNCHKEVHAFNDLRFLEP